MIHWTGLVKCFLHVYLRNLGIVAHPIHQAAPQQVAFDTPSGHLIERALQISYSSTVS